MAIASKIFTAKYDGTCNWSGQAIVAGETEIVLIRGTAYIAEYGDGVEIAKSLLNEWISLLESDGQHDRATKQRRQFENSLEGAMKFGDPFKTARQIRQQISYWNEDE